MSAKSKELLYKTIGASVAYFISLMAFYLNIGQNMGSYWVPILLPIIAGLTIIQFTSRKFILSQMMLPNLIAGLAWCSAFPLLYTWTYERPWFMSLVSYDFIIGTSMFLFLVSLEILLMSTTNIKFSAGLITALNFLFMVIPFVEYTYYCMVWHCLSPASLMALYLTNWNESIDFIRGSIGDLNAVIILLVIAFLLKKAYNVHKKFADHIINQQIDRRHKFAVAIVLVCSFASLIYYVPQNSLAGLWKNVTDYVAEMQQYEVGHSERVNNLQINAADTLAAKSTGTIIFVIGESASRSYMRAFNPNFEFDDTPELSAKMREGFDKNGFIVYPNIYSCWSQTVPVLQRVLTEQSQYNEKEFYDSTSIIDAARKAGYKTYWFSNQGRYGEYDSAITIVAKTADVSEWTDDAYDFSDKYDITLMKYLEKLDGSANNFVVLHLMGSHIYYNNRYPKDFKRWVTEDGTGMATAAPSYANTILYTDYVLSQIYEYATKNLNLQAMIYFSDHGENLQISHNPDVFSFDMVRIPMFIYLSPDYQKALPERAAALYNHKDEYFTNDMLYDTICGIMNAPSNRYEARQDFSSEDYGFTRETLTTMLGRYKLTDDAGN
ncbi:MAG: phosphoethanolamine transferase [Selenomonadaceae bacterium]|nr:phosphoethanolamine transferase [Selenomonadaceae bacterium]